MINGLKLFGLYLSMLGNVFSRPENKKIYIRRIVDEMIKLGVNSLTIVSIISLFMGAVVTIQTGLQLNNPFIPKYLIGYATRESLILEFSPTMIALILAGKVGSSIASEIGTMRVSEQIDALEIMGINSAAFIIQPKIIASVLFFPFLVIISISIVLFLISSFTLIALNSEKIINDFKENIPVVVFIKDQSNKIELSKFEKNLEINNTIKKFDFISKKDAANKLSEEIGEDFIDYLGYNPLYDSYDIFFTSDNVNNLFIDQLVEEFKNESFVEEVTYDAPLIDLINKNILILKQWSLIIGSIFLFISIILMNNTIRLSVYSNRLNIKTMQLVGATKFFIKKPFIITHIKLGVLSSIISSVLLVVILYYLNLNFFEIDFEKIKESVFITLVFSLGISVIISYFSTSIITGRYISSNIEKLY